VLLVSGVSSTTLSQSTNENTEKPTRLGINSLLLLDVLAKVTGEAFNSSSNVIVRPFRHLVYHETKIRDALREAEDQCADTEGEEGPKQQETQRTRDELRLLVEFMDKDMADIFDIRQKIQTPTLRCSLKTIAFEYLWLLFNPGDVVLSSSSRPGSEFVQMFTVMHVSGGRLLFQSPRRDDQPQQRSEEVNSFQDSDLEQRSKSINSPSARVSSFIIDCVYIDSDGFHLGPKPKRFVIPVFAGKRPIQSLGVYPAVFNSGYESIRERLVRRGKRLVEVSSGSHRLYSGMTINEFQRGSGYSYIHHDGFCQQASEEVSEPSAV